MSDTKIHPSELYAKIPTEFEFYRVLHKMEKALDEKDVKKDDYENFLQRFNSDNRSTRSIGEFVYDGLGVVGGAYIFADLANDQLLSFYNRNLQKELKDGLKRKLLSDTSENEKGNIGLPFIEIPYHYYKYDKKYYNHPSLLEKEKEDRRNHTSNYRSVLDAMFIGTREKQHIKDNENIPEFYSHHPSYRDAKEEKRILPFEKKLNKDGLDIIYCEVGEVMFHLYVWRYLFRLIQTQGQNSKLDKKTINPKFEDKFLFWEAMKEQKGSRENYWLEYIEGRVNLKKDWESLRKSTDTSPYDTNFGFSFDQELQLLGLISEDKNDEQDEDKKLSRSFLHLLKYAIFIAENTLKWNISEFSSLTEKSSKAKLHPSNEECLYNLHLAERWLDNYFVEEHYKIPNPQFGTCSFIFLTEKFEVYKCLNQVINHYLYSLLKKNETPTLKNLISTLHKSARFPIIPYYYEIAASKYHLPKEHVVLKIWDSGEKMIPIKGENDSAVGFVALTIKPIFETYYKTDFIKGNRGVHSISILAEAAYNRIFRLKILFRSLARPIIDTIFYGNLIRKEIENNYYQKYLNSFSHEMSKITDNIFEKSTVNVKDFFKSHTHEVIDKVKPFITRIPTGFNTNELENWKIIPNPEIFQTWGTLLRIWSGRRHHQIFKLDIEASLAVIIEECVETAIKLSFVDTNKSKETTNSLVKAINFKKSFQQYCIETKKKKSAHIEEKQQIPNVKFIDNKKYSDSEIVIEKQNAFLRLFMAALVNIYEHTSGEYYLQSKLVNDKLTVNIINPYIDKYRRKKAPDSLGTEPVLSSCLNRVSGKLIRFEKITEADKEYNIWKNRINPTPEESIWITKFDLKINDIFQST